MTISPFTPLGSIGPLTRVSAFTHRDNATYLRILQEIVQYINETLTPEMDAKLADVLVPFNEKVAEFNSVVTTTRAEWEALFNTFTVDVTELKAEWATLFDAFMADVVDQLAALNDDSVGQLIGTPASATAVALKVHTDAVRADVSTELDGVEGGIRADLATKERVNEVTRLYPVDPVDVVFIGDSYFSGYQPLPTPWLNPVPERVVSLMNARDLGDFVVHNYANNAGGYDTTIGGGDTYFDTQVTAAINDASITNCRLIVVGGGRNDSGKDVYVKAKAIYNRLKNKWPNAKLVVFPMWSNEIFKRDQRVTFNSIFAAAKDVGATYDTNSLWVNAFTGAEMWIDVVPHPKDELMQRFAYALCSLIQGGTLPAQSTDISKHSSSGITEAVAELNGMSATVSLQQYVGANFDGSYILGTLQYPVLRPGNINQYVNGYSGNGANLTLFTVGVSGDIAATTTGTMGLVGFTASYPLGM